MLDTNARKYIDPFIDKVAKEFIGLGINANQVTSLSLIIGLFGAIALFFGKSILSIVMLWLSGFFDVLDGAIARSTGTKSLLGAQFDIVSDRVVELSYFWALALTNKDAAFAIMFLITTAFLSMTVFLTTCMISKNTTKKSFYYQAGLMERTEGFILTTAMIVFKNSLSIVAYLYGGLILITVIQRIMDTIKINSRGEL